MTAKDVIDIASAEVGYLEKKSNSQLDDKTANDGSNNYTKYARDMASIGAYNGSKQGLAWCDVFVDWCIWMANNKSAGWNDTIYQPMKREGAGCEYSAQYYKSNAAFFKTPQKGDQIFFAGADGKPCHTGLVFDVLNGQVITIEGNTSSAAGVIANGGCVAKKSYAINYAKIYGYGRPKYNKESEDEEMTDEQKQALDLIAPKYKYNDENIPQWAKSAVDKAVAKKVYSYGDDGFDPALNDLQIRELKVFEKLGLLG